MYKQLSLFPELMEPLVNNLEEKIEEYTKDVPEELKEVIKKAFKCGALMILSDIIDLLKKYTDLHES